MHKFLIAILLLCFIPSCSTSTNEELKKKSFQIDPGMDKKVVLKSLGLPSNRQFKADAKGNLFEALQWDLGWHEGLASDFRNRDMLLVYFRNNKVTGLNNYVAYYGDIKSVRWEERPDFIVEARIR